MEAECDHNTEIFEGTPAALEADVKPKISAISLPDGYSMRRVGESETSGDAIGNLMKYVPVTLFLIFFVLLLLFNSWKNSYCYAFHSSSAESRPRCLFSVSRSRSWR